MELKKEMLLMVLETCIQMLQKGVDLYKVSTFLALEIDKILNGYYEKGFDPDKEVIETIKEVMKK